MDTVSTAAGRGALGSSRLGGIRLAYFVREAFPTHRADLDVLFAEELASRGHVIEFIMQAATPEHAGLQSWRGCRVLAGATDNGRRFSQRLRKHWLALRHELSCLFRVSRRDHDAVQVRDKILIAAIAAPVARLRGLKFFYWLSFPMSESQVSRAREGTARYPMLSWLRGTLAQWVLYRWIMPLSHHVFVQSEQMKRDVMARGIAASRLSPVPMGIARRDVRPARAPDAGKAVSFPAQFLVGYLGTLNRQRRLDMLIDMLSLLRGAGVDARLLVVGGGEEPGDDQLLRQRAVELGVDGHVEITGFMPRTQALERMSSVDVGVSPFFPAPTLRSTSPTKLVEYFALGLPVVANDHPEQRLVLRGSRGGICVPWGARHFAKALRLLADADPEWRRALGERGREWVLGNRTYERIADDVSDVYQRVCAGG